MAVICFLFPFFTLLSSVITLPVGNLNISRSQIKHAELLPPDHIPGAHMEHDGHVNKDYHHEAFLGTLIKDGTLKWENLEGYKNLIDIYHKVDANNDHRVDHNELKNWIHNRIIDHYQAAKKDSDSVFQKVDHNKTGVVSWSEYKAQLLGLNPAKFMLDNSTIIDDQTGDFQKEVKHWLKADINNDHFLDQQEFLSFLHPEQNQHTLEMMADEMMPNLDRDKDGKISLEEFTRLPPGEVDPAEAELDKQYQAEQAREFKEDMDSNGDNIVTREEFLKYLDPRHIRNAFREADHLIRISDRDRDDKLSEHEMLMNYEVFTGSSFTSFDRLLHDEF